MGERGPIPKRSDVRHGHRSKAEVGSVTSAPGAVLVSQPAADPGWHPLAGDWYRSLAESGQAVFYEPSDWQTARVWAEVLSRQLSGSRVSAQMIAAWASGATELLTTEGARRRGRLELQRSTVDEDEAASVTALERYRDQLGA